MAAPNFVASTLTDADWLMAVGCYPAVQAGNRAILNGLKNANQRAWACGENHQSTLSTIGSAANSGVITFNPQSEVTIREVSLESAVGAPIYDGVGAYLQLGPTSFDQGRFIVVSGGGAAVSQYVALRYFEASRMHPIILLPAASQAGVLFALQLTLYNYSGGGITTPNLILNLMDPNGYTVA